MLLRRRYTVARRDWGKATDNQVGIISGAFVCWPFDLQAGELAVGRMASSPDAEALSEALFGRMGFPVREAAARDLSRAAAESYIRQPFRMRVGDAG